MPQTKWQIENKDRWRAYMKAYRERRKALGIRPKYEESEASKQRKKKYMKQYYLRTKAHHADARRASYLKNAEEIKERQRQREYRESANKAQRERRLSNPEKYRTRELGYRNRHLQAYQEYRHNYRMRERQAAGRCSYKQLKARFDYHGNKCIYCAGIGDLTVDHLIPLTRGGTNWPANLAPACRSCNGRKRHRTYQEFMEILTKCR